MSAVEFSTTRLVLLGASNLTRALPLVIALARTGFDGRLELLIAHGHGRSYGQASRLLGRELPGIRQCRLWQRLHETTFLPTYALLTDIGNDLLYGTSVTTIAAWLEECLRDLAAVNARISMTRLPLANIAALPEWRFRLLRNVLFPRSRHSLTEIREAVYSLDQRMTALAARYPVQLLQTSPQWYGLDTMHIVRSRRAPAWRYFLRAWLDERKLPTVIQPSARWLPLLPPAQSVWFGLPLQRPQPVVLHSSEETSIFLY